MSTQFLVTEKVVRPKLDQPDLLLRLCVLSFMYTQILLTNFYFKQMISNYVPAIAT